MEPKIIHEAGINSGDLINEGVLESVLHTGLVIGVTLLTLLFKIGGAAIKWLSKISANPTGALQGLDRDIREDMKAYEGMDADPEKAKLDMDLKKLQYMMKFLDNEKVKDLFGKVWIDEYIKEYKEGDDKRDALISAGIRAVRRLELDLEGEVDKMNNAVSDEHSLTNNQFGNGAKITLKDGRQYVSWRAYNTEGGKRLIVVSPETWAEMKRGKLESAIKPDTMFEISLDEVTSVNDKPVEGEDLTSREEAEGIVNGDLNTNVYDQIRSVIEERPAPELLRKICKGIIYELNKEYKEIVGKLNRIDSMLHEDIKRTLKDGMQKLFYIMDRLDNMVSRHGVEEWSNESLDAISSLRNLLKMEQISRKIDDFIQKKLNPETPESPPAESPGIPESHPLNNKRGWIKYDGSWQPTTVQQHKDGSVHAVFVGPKGYTDPVPIGDKELSTFVAKSSDVPEGEPKSWSPDWWK